MSDLTEVTDEQLKNKILTTATKKTATTLSEVTNQELKQQILSQAVGSGAEPNQSPINQAVETKPSSYLDRMSSLRDKRIEEVSTTFEKLANSEIGIGSAALQTVGKGGFGAFLDFAGESVTTGLSTVTPDFIEDPFKEAMVFLAGEVADTEVLKQAKAEWDKLDSNTKNNLESAGNILATLLPKLKIKGAGTKIASKGEAMRKARISEAVKLPDTIPNKVKEAQRFFRDPVGHKQMVDELAKVKGIKATNGAAKNLNIVKKELSRTESQLQNLVRTQPKKVDASEIYSAINRNMDELLQEQTWLTSDVVTKNALQNNLKAVNKILLKHPKTTEGLLKARREIDGLMNNKRKLQLPASELTVKDAITKTLRDSINEVVDSKYQGGKFKSLLNKEHQLLKARENLAFRYGNEVASVRKALNLIKQHPVVAGGIVQGSGMAIGLLTNPYLTAASAVGGTTFMGYRALPASLRGLGKSLELAGEVGQRTARLPTARASLLYGNEEETEEQPQQ